MQKQARSVMQKARRNANPVLKPLLDSCSLQCHWPKQISRPSQRQSREWLQSYREVGMERWRPFLRPLMHSTYHSCLWLRTRPFLASISLTTIPSALNTRDKPSIQGQPLLNDQMSQLPSQAVTATNNKV